MNRLKYDPFFTRHAHRLQNLWCAQTCAFSLTMSIDTLSVVGRPLILSCLKSGIAQRYCTLSWQRGWLNSRIPDIMTTYKILSHYTNEEALEAVKQLIAAPLDLISTWLYKESLMLHVEHTGTGWLVLRLFSHLVDLGCIFRDIK